MFVCFSLQAFMALARDIKAKMDKKLVNWYPITHMNAPGV